LGDIYEWDFFPDVLENRLKAGKIEDEEIRK
jgi:hypothetical protein